MVADIFVEKFSRYSIFPVKHASFAYFVKIPNCSVDISATILKSEVIRILSLSRYKNPLCNFLMSEEIK